MMNFNFPADRQFDSMAKKVLTAVLIWIFAIVVFVAAVSLQRSNGEYLKQSGSVLNAATVVKAYKVSEIAPSTDGGSLSSLTDIINAAGLSDRVSQLDSGSSGTIIKAERVYPDEFEKLVSLLSSKGMQVTAAEMRAVNINGERLLFIRLSLGGAAL